MPQSGFSSSIIIFILRQTTARRWHSQGSSFLLCNMSDDGLQLNFAIADSESILSRNGARFKGGTWKDRLSAKRAAQRHERKPAKGTSDRFSHQQNSVTRSIFHQGDDQPVQGPAKRRREHGEFRPENQTQSKGIADSRTQTNGKPREVISSLFSYNPKPSHAENEVTKIHAEPSQPSNAPLPDGIDTFTSLGLSTTLSAHLLTKMTLMTPTGIQKSAVSQLVKNDTDAFIQSQTGSGKTLAYLLPLVERIMQLSAGRNKDDVSALHRDTGLFAIIIAPTRELCKQILVVLERLLGCANWIVAGSVIGGEKKKSEKARLRKGLNILVATPGRLADHLDNTRTLDVSAVRWLVLDEGDRLMDLGFEEEIQKIVTKLDARKRPKGIPGLPASRTTVLCSATMKMNVQKLGEISLKDAVLVKSDIKGVTSNELDLVAVTQPSFSAPAQLKQSYTIAAPKLRLVALIGLLKRTFARKGSVMKAIVFCSCADSVDFHFEALSRSDSYEAERSIKPETKEFAPKEDAPYPSPPAEDNPETKLSSGNDAATTHLPIRRVPLLTSKANPDLMLYKLHGSLTQQVRTQVVRSFATSKTPSLLIATDVASRGLDLPNLDLVIEYDPPFSVDDHIHRIGRTARLGRDGRAMIFLMPGSEEGYVQVLRDSFQNLESGSRPPVTHTSYDEILKKGFTPTSGITTGRDWKENATEFQLETERWVLSDPAHQELARKAFMSHVRAYATHVAAERKYFDIKELHLGHLAKAFGLRDRPSNVSVPGRVKGATSGQRRAVGGDGRRPKGSGISDGREDPSGATVSRKSDADDAAVKMRALVRNKNLMMGAGSSEFNLA